MPEHVEKNKPKMREASQGGITPAQLGYLVGSASASVVSEGCSVFSVTACLGFRD